MKSLVAISKAVARSIATNLSVEAPSKAPRGYITRKASYGDRKTALEVMRKSFFIDEPAVVGAGLSPNSVTSELQDYVVNSMGEGTSFLALNVGDQRPVGLCLNGTTCPSDDEYLEKLASKCGGPSGRLMQFWAFLDKEADIYNRFNVPFAWEIRFLAVLPCARGQGMATELALRSRELARVRQYPMLTCYCTSEYSAKICRSMGMEEVFRVAYKDYRNKYNEPLLTVPHGHKQVSVYAQTLSRVLR